MTTDVPVKFDELDGITVGTVEGTSILDGVNVSSFGDRVIEHVKDKTGVHLLLNFENITYMSSAGLTELLRINQVVKPAGGSTRLCGLTNDIEKVFRITNLDKMFSIHHEENVESAAQRFKRSLAVASEESAWAGQDTGA